MAKTHGTHRYCGRSCLLAYTTWKVVAVYAAGVFLLCARQSYGHRLQQVLLHRTLQDDGKSTPTVATSSTCTLQNSNDNAEPSAPLLTLSVDNPTVTLNCSGNNNEVVPDDPLNVCSAQTSTFGKCVKNESNTQVALKVLLESTESITATVTPYENSTGQKWTLSLNEFPLVDQAFVVGCRKKGQNTDTDLKCKVTVLVKARTSTIDQDTVTCAYGQSSNPAPVHVELTKTNKVFKLACGQRGAVTPTTISSQFCETVALEKCDRKYTEILPNFSDSWWTTPVNGSDPLKFQVPEGGFPTVDQMFYLGCLPAKAAGDPNVAGSSDAMSQERAAGNTSCKVLVTVKAASSPSLALSGMPAAALAAGVAAFSGFGASWI